MKRTTRDTTTASDQALVTAAARGDEASFDELHRRHAPLAWRLALAITGDPDLAARAVADGTGTVFTALRAGRFPAQPHGTALAAAARNAALDLRRSGATTSPAVADEGDALVARAFAALPERWRSVLWLRDAEGMAAADVAPVVELDADAVDQLGVRARRGLRERYVRAQVAAVGGRDCTRAVTRLGALDDGTLKAADAATLERHLSSCAPCADRRQRVAGLVAALPALALPPAADLRDKAHATWTAALASSTHTGLSPRTEKVLAGASAFAAAVGVLGATLFGSNGGGEPTASPLAPLVADIETPRPVDLSAVTLPLMTPDRDAFTGRSLASGATASTLNGGALPAGGATSEVAAPAAPAPSTDIGTPAAEAPTSPVPAVPVAVDPEEGIIVGPINLDPTPDVDEPALEVDAPEPIAQVTDPVVDAANDAVEPVLEAAEPVTTPVLEATQTVTEPVLEATQPITDAVESVAGGLGL